MAFFDKLGEITKSIGDKTTDAIETGKLNNKINSEKAAAGEDFKKIGEYYYGKYMEGAEVAPEVVEFCNSAKAHFDAAAEAQAEIERIKAENEAEKAAAAPAVAAAPVAPEAAAAPVMPAASAVATAPVGGIVCPSCGTTNSEGTKFCQNCGNKLEIPAPVIAGNVCPNCSTVNDDGMKFCKECGSRLEIPAPTEPVKRFCSACGTEVAPGVKFCPQCGQKMEQQ